MRRYLIRIGTADLCSTYLWYPVFSSIQDVECRPKLIACLLGTHNYTKLHFNLPFSGKIPGKSRPICVDVPGLLMYGTLCTYGPNLSAIARLSVLKMRTVPKKSRRQNISVEKESLEAA